MILQESRSIYEDKVGSSYLKEDIMNKDVWLKESIKEDTLL